MKATLRPDRPRADPGESLSADGTCRASESARAGGPLTYPLHLLALLGLLGAALLLSVSVGAAGIPIRLVIDTLLGGGDDTSRAIVLQLRLPRAVLAALVGGGLALAGAIFQALLRNPLAEPYVLGVSGGAAVGAVAAVATGATAASALALPAAAFLGAGGAIALVFGIATRTSGGGLDSRVLLLAGVIVGAFFNAVILLLLSLADVETFRSAVFWMMGSLTAASWPAAGSLAVLFVPALLLLLALARPLNLMAIGEETAHHLGANVERVKLVAYLTASLLVAAGVAVSGVIGFVGLIVPHAIRLVWGTDHRLLLPAALLLGGTFLVAADTAARTIAAPAELPVGVVTALVGVPLFVVLLTRRAP